MELKSREVRQALEKAIERAETRVNELLAGRRPDPSSKAEAAIQKLLKDRQLSLEELHRPTTI